MDFNIIRDPDHKMEGENMLKEMLAVLIVSVILSGCVSIFKPQDQLLPQGYDQMNVTIKYIKNGTVLDKNSFPGFNLTEHIYFVTPDNLPITADTEMSHGMSPVDASVAIPSGFRIYGDEEAYTCNSTYNNTSDQRYMRLQYKVFDNSSSLDNLLDRTSYSKLNAGFKSVKVNGTGTYKGQVYALENSSRNMTIDMILFKYDTVIGMIGVQDYKDRSLNESLKILDIIQKRVKINEKQVQISNTFFSHANPQNGGT
jgi:hypothetical protein